MYDDACCGDTEGGRDFACVVRPQAASGGLWHMFVQAGRVDCIVTERLARGRANGEETWSGVTRVWPTGR